jgi:FKBP-type peptidyl-prolyl cis-trans isomerase
MNFKSIFTSVIAIAMIGMACTDTSQDYSPEASLNTMEDSVSYSIGFQSGSRFNQQGFAEIDVENFLAGLQDGLQGEESEMGNTNLQDLFNRFNVYLMDKIKAENTDEQETFLAENLEKEGVMETASGLQYKVIEEGSGESPTAQDSVLVHYTGQLVDGTIFDTSRKEVAQENDLYSPAREPYAGAKFLAGGVVPGFTEGLLLMQEGAVYEIYIPSELAYGERPRPGGPIQPNDMLIFEIELLEVIKN